MQWFTRMFERLRQRQPAQGAHPGEQSTGELSRCQALLGTYVEIHLSDPSGQASDTALIAISQAAYKRIENVQAQMSFHDPKSALSRINSSAHIAPRPLSPELTDVLRQALTLSRLSDGHFDITIAPQMVAQGLLPEHRSKAEQQTPVRGSWRDIELSESAGRHWIFFKRPLQLDLGGIAKGYAVDQAMLAAQTLAQKKLGASHSLSISINAGGDLRSNQWQGSDVSLRHPSAPQQLLSSTMKNTALATSGGYFIEQGSAIIEPHDRKPLKITHSVSVFADNCMLADALTKVALLHPNAEALIAELGGQLVRIEQDDNTQDDTTSFEPHTQDKI